MFAIDALRFCDKLPYCRATDNLCKQFIRCATSVGANYKAAQRAKSTADFINKLKISEEEADECTYWLELMLEIRPAYENDITKLLAEAGELTAIFVSSIKTTRQKLK